jgi:hypothetical protein
MACPKDIAFDAAPLKAAMIDAAISAPPTRFPSRTVLPIKFAHDSPLEQSGFELWVPPACDAPGSHKVRC